VGLSEWIYILILCSFSVPSIRSTSFLKLNLNTYNFGWLNVDEIFPRNIQIEYANCYFSYIQWYPEYICIHHIIFIFLLREICANLVIKLFTSQNLFRVEIFFLKKGKERMIWVKKKCRERMTQENDEKYVFKRKMKSFFFSFSHRNLAGWKLLNSGINKGKK